MFSLPKRGFTAIAKVVANFLGNRSGNFALISGLMLIPVVGAVGCGVDFIAASSARKALQNAADSAVLAAAASPAGKEQTVVHDFLAAHLGGDDGVVQNEHDHGWTHTVSVAENLVELVVNDVYDTSFMRVLGVNAVPIAVIAKASRPSNSACILILDPAVADALKVVNANSVTSECGIQVNSAHKSRAFYAENNGYTFSAPHIAVHGVSKLGSGKALNPPPVNGAPVVADPLASMEEPVARTAPCTWPSLQTINSHTKITINPGVYCGGLTLNTSDDVTLKPGIYTFRDGPFTLNASAKVIGKGVLLYFEDEKSAFLSNGAAIMELSAPTTGKHAGILMFQGRKAAEFDVRYRLNTAAGSFYDGTIYLPYAVIDWNVSGSVNAAASYTALIAKVLRLYVSGAVIFKKPGSGTATPAPAALAGAGGVRLVQ